MKLYIVPIELANAKEFVESHHRHHLPPVGHRFSIACIDANGKIRGVAIAGRPVSRNIDQSRTIEVTRLCTDGTRNACSLLYGACARSAKELGYESIQTYTLPEEGGSSLRGSGWVCEGHDFGGGIWKDSERTKRTNSHPLGKKSRWKKKLSDKKPDMEKLTEYKVGGQLNILGVK